MGKWEVRGTFLQVPGQDLDPSVWEPVQVSESSKGVPLRELRLLALLQVTLCHTITPALLEKSPWMVTRCEACPVAEYGPLKTPLSPTSLCPPPTAHTKLEGKLGGGVLPVLLCRRCDCWSEGAASGSEKSPPEWDYRVS